jgi:hypothetical protein
MSHQIHTYAKLRQQVHGDLRIQHPEWVEPNGESSMDLMELLDTLTHHGEPSSQPQAYKLHARKGDFPSQ